MFTDALLALSRPRTIIGRLADLRRAPFNVSVPAQTSGAAFNWSGQGLPKPIGDAAFESVVLGHAKGSGILIISEELARARTLAAETALRDELVAGLTQFFDQQFVDPAVAAVSNVSPASILNGVTDIPSSGDPHTDITTLVSVFVTASPDTSALAFLMSPTNAVVLAATGDFPDVELDGGRIFGVPVVTSSALGSNIALIDPRQILLADDGQMDLSVSRQASVQMNTTPDDPATASTVLTSLWQNNLVGIRVERQINWKRGRDSAVQYVSGTAYIGTSPPAL